MKALITGASSGIGREMAKYLSELGCNLILVARDKEKLEQLQSELKSKSQIIVLDLSSEQKVKELYVLCRNYDIDILINNAGFGDCGYFTSTDLSNELNMLDVNIRAVHILTKMFLRDMKKKNHGYILNVASTAAFQPGPLMATYYATKAYVLHLTEAINEELRRIKSQVCISCLCPGPVDTNFNNVANVEFKLKGFSAERVAKIAIDEMFKGKMLIIPGFKMKCVKFFSRFLSDRALLKMAYKIQRSKKANPKS